MLPLFPTDAPLPAPLTAYDPALALPDFADRVARLRSWQQRIASGYVGSTKEEVLKSEFLTLIFGQVLGYEDQRHDYRQLVLEKKTNVDGTKPDGALGDFAADGKGALSGPVRVVVELKNARTLLDAKQKLGAKGRAETPVEQAFSYPSKMGASCRWVVVSNFIELRLYAANDQTRAEVFLLDTLPDQPSLLQRFFTLLAAGQVLPLPTQADAPLDLALRHRQEQEARISKDFYKDYRKARRNLLDHLIEQNPAVPPLALLQYTQKLLDRVIFICFCEDKRIIPEQTFKHLLEVVEANVFDRADDSIYRSVRGLFNFIDKGNEKAKINRFNGGLFAADSALDLLVIKDGAMKPIVELGGYDFASELNVNILGHIFEQSLADLEAERARLLGEAPPDTKKGKQKQDGIFYTPDYITRYIVSQAVGGWLRERREESGLDTLPELTEADLASVRVRQIGSGLLTPTTRVQQHITAWETYGHRLRNIRVLDPACGSGAFLNEAFGYLLREGQVVNDTLAKLKANQRDAFLDLDRHILSHNLYGVDLNHESVQITRLSLWLQTANPGRPLTSLDHSIRVGNSLIADPAVAGDLAFDWQAAFPEVFTNGGFDVVIGNPPYVQSHSLDELTKEYIYKNYTTAEYQINTYAIFLELSKNLANTQSHYGFIIPNYWISTKFDSRLRKLLMIENNLNEIINTYQVFNSAKVDTVVISGTYTESSIFPKKTTVKSISDKIRSIKSRLLAIEHKNWQSVTDFYFLNSDDDPTVNLKPKFVLSGVNSVGDLFTLKKGMQPYELGKGTPPQNKEMMIRQVYDAPCKIDETYKPLLRARNIKRYLLDWTGDWIKYGINLAAPRSESIFKGERILFRRIISTPKIEGLFLDGDYINNTDVIVMIPKNESVQTKAISAIIMSSLCASILKKENINLSRTAFPKINVGTIEKFPLPSLSATNVVELEQGVDALLAGYRAIHAADVDFAALLRAELGLTSPLSGKLALTKEWRPWSTALQKSIGRDLNLKEKGEWLKHHTAHQQAQAAARQHLAQLDKDLDKLVYDLYQLTPAEIALVEGTSAELVS
ncbi:N-6 DNA methylase [Hymenobacter sp. BT559]|uniref:Eco57I restriction-modification methylase domain-containing protein n=1 Tax=Hymenobacter sp. BT559 TaxID=2795729 RepID=UPI0018EB8CF9|nr:N-6 DNA methylase [Hymenobacter sp. BT559]MBJ6146381.1 N-6 DNA methylase [Hymenobacter sp. BT559]